MRFQIVTLRVPFDPATHDPPSSWDWPRMIGGNGFLQGMAQPLRPVMVHADPVSEDPDVQPIEQLPDEPLANVGAPDPDPVGVCDHPAHRNMHAHRHGAYCENWRAMPSSPPPAGAPDDVWAEHPLYSRSSWQYEVGNGDTNQGYWDWCALQAQDDDNPANQEAP